MIGSPSRISSPNRASTFSRITSSSTGMFGSFESVNNSISIMPRELTVTSPNRKRFWDGIRSITYFYIDLRMKRSWARPITYLRALISTQNLTHSDCDWVEFEWMCVQSTRWSNPLCSVTYCLDNSFAMNYCSITSATCSSSSNWYTSFSKWIWRALLFSFPLSAVFVSLPGASGTGLRVFE